MRPVELRLLACLVIGVHPQLADGAVAIGKQAPSVVALLPGDDNVGVQNPQVGHARDRRSKDNKCGGRGRSKLDQAAVSTAVAPSGGLSAAYRT